MFIRAQGGGSRVPFVNDPSDSNDAPVHSPDDEPPFPALTHLHIVCQGDKLHPWEQTLPLWALLAPALTHLRISQANTRIHEVVRRAVGIASPHGSAEADAPPTSVPSADLLFANLRRLVVQRLAENAVQSGVIAQELWEISEQVEARGYAVGPRLVVLRSRAHDMWYWRARLPWEWVARMDGCGGGGCWEGHEEDEEVYAFERVWGITVCSKAGEKVTEAGENDEAAARGKKSWWKKFRISRRHTA
ncbi:hypothetical protein A0H81_13498 [Grifola frondosa]|uniref:Uncharacterized protein n=1 Tax=Grifola frondosa TaxID=5627 RepID=A0A1C7LUZ7_GRIFR|nr:hypothetical protein A0H81_13498 [Grifola frondosa]